MKIILFHRPGAVPAPRVAETLAAIRARGFEAVENDFGAPASLLLCLGGDGTLLEGIRRLDGAPTPVAGLNAGRLGFLATADASGLGALLDDLSAGRLRTERRAMLRVDFGGETRYAVNEASLQRRSAGMITVDASVDGPLVASVHGDGLLVATPTGSTAYSLSVGGPILSPACAALVVAPVAPHNLTMRPVVIPDSSEVRLTVRTRDDGEAAVAVDSELIPVGDGATLSIRRAERDFLLVPPPGRSFYDTLREKMMWGVDARSEK